MLKIWKQCIAVVALAAASLAVPSAILAQKTGGAGQNGGGLIYFSYNNKLYTMKDDGSGVTLVSAFPRAPWGEPSRDKHDGKRWIAQRESVPGEFGPDGYVRKELVALSDAGHVVPLAISADLDPLTQPRWVLGDGSLSWVGRQWDNDPDSSSFGDILEGGLYVTPLAFDEAGNVAASSGASFLLVNIPLTADGAYPDIASHDWSPDGTAFVFDTSAHEQLVIADLLTETFQVVLSRGIVREPRWSPTGSKLMIRYNDGDQRDGVWVMNIDGTGLKLLEASRTRSRPEVGVWSPTGSHLVYQHYDRVVVDSYIIRTKADGSGGTRITSKNMGAGEWPPFPLGWRQ